MLSRRRGKNENEAAAIFLLGFQSVCNRALLLCGDDSHQCALEQNDKIKAPVRFLKIKHSQREDTGA